MTFRPASIHRIVPWLGALLTVAALVTLRKEHLRGMGFGNVDKARLLFLLLYLSAAAVGLYAAWRAKRSFDERSGRRLLINCLALNFCIHVLTFTDVADGRLPGRNTFFYFLTETLTTACAPVLWGSALARVAEPQDSRSRSFGRRLAVILVVTLSIDFVCQLAFSGFHSWWETLLYHFKPKHLYWTSFRSLPAFFLLWGCVEELWPVRSADPSGRRATMVHWAMLGWFASRSGWWVYVLVKAFLNSSSLGQSVWSALLLQTLLLLTAAAAFLWFSRAKPGPATETATPN